jgi:hypothetical protein
MAEKPALVHERSWRYFKSMVNSELARTLDYILNRCDEAAIEAVAAAVLRRRRELTVFGGALNLPDPQRMARNLSTRLDISGAVEGLKGSIRDMALRIIRQEAPELSDEQVQELAKAWIPDGNPGDDAPPAGDPALPDKPGLHGKPEALHGKPEALHGKPGLPGDLLRSMIDQFTAFSQGTMDREEDRELRDQLGPWPQRYWKAFPPVIRLFITDYLKGEIDEKDFRGKIETALSIGF